MTLPLTAAASVMWLTLAAPFFGLPRPLTPLQALWIIVLTAAFVPLVPGARARGVIWRVLWLPLLMAALALGMEYWYWATGNARWRTVVFTTLACSQIVHAVTTRPAGVRLVAAGAVAGVLQAAVVFVPWLPPVMGTAPLFAVDLRNCAIALIVVAVPIVCEGWLRGRVVPSSRE